jgi:hypothetical protein
MKEPLPQGYAKGPYCLGCWDKEDRPSLLRKAIDMEKMDGRFYTCPVCNQGYH